MKLLKLSQGSSDVNLHFGLCHWCLEAILYLTPTVPSTDPYTAAFHPPVNLDYSSNEAPNSSYKQFSPASWIDTQSADLSLVPWHCLLCLYSGLSSQMILKWPWSSDLWLWTSTGRSLVCSIARRILQLWPEVFGIWSCTSCFIAGDWAAPQSFLCCRGWYCFSVFHIIEDHSLDSNCPSPYHLRLLHQRWR